MTVPIYEDADIVGGTGQGTIGFSDGAATQKLAISRAAATGKHLYVGAVIWGSQDFTSIDGEPVGALVDWDDVLAGKTTVTSTVGSSHCRIGMWHTVVTGSTSLDITVVKNNTTGAALMWAAVCDAELTAGDVSFSTANSTMSAVPAVTETTRSMFVGVKNSQSTTAELDWDLTGGAQVLGDFHQTTGTTKLGLEVSWLDTPTLTATRSVTTDPVTTCRIMAYQLNEELPATPEDQPPVVTVPAAVTIFPAQSRTAITSATDPEGQDVTFTLTASQSWMAFTDLGHDSLTNTWRCSVVATPPPGTAAGTYVATIEAEDEGANVVEFDVTFNVQACSEFVRMPNGQLLPVVATTVNTPADPEPAPTGQWRRWIVKTPAELAAGNYGGGGKQLMRAGGRSVSDPTRAFYWVDVAHTLRTDNATASPGSVLWHRPVDDGLGTLATTAGAVSRTDPDRAVVLCDDHFESWNFSREGLYLTTDGGESWSHVLTAHPDVVEAEGAGVGGVAGNNSAPTRLYHETIVNSIHDANHWFAMIDSDGLYRSTSNGAAGTWTKIWDVSANANVKDVYKVLESPTVQGEFYLACYRNVWKLTSAHSGTLTATNIRGTLSGTAEKRYICFENGADGSSDLICSVKNVGAYRSALHDGTDWTLAFTYSNLEYLWVNPRNASKVLRVAIDNVGVQGAYSLNGVAGPYTNMTTIPAPGWSEVGGGWGERIQGRWVGFLPHATDENDIICHSQGVLWKTTDGGRNWTSANELNCGYNSGWAWRNAYFDPEDPLHIWTSVSDVGPCETENGGRSWTFTDFLDTEKNFASASAHGCAPMNDSRSTIVAAIGDTNHSYLMRSTSRGVRGGWTNVNPGVDRRFLGIWPYKLAPTMSTSTRNLAKQFALAGYQKTTNAGTTWVSSGLTTDAEWNGYMWNDPDVFYAIQHLGTNPRRKIHRGVVDLATGGVTVSEVVSLAYALPNKGAWAFGHTSRDKLYICTSGGEPASFSVATQTATSLNLFNEATLSALDASYNWLAVQMIDVCAINDNWLVVLLNLHGESMVWRTLDGGTTWEDISKNLPRIVNGTVEWFHHTGEILFSSAAGYWVHPAPDSYTPTKPLLYSNCAPVDQIFS